MHDISWYFCSRQVKGQTPWTPTASSHRQSKNNAGVEPHGCLASLRAPANTKERKLFCTGSERVRSEWHTHIKAPIYRTPCFPVHLHFKHILSHSNENEPLRNSRLQLTLMVFALNVCLFDVCVSSRSYYNSVYPSHGWSGYSGWSYCHHLAWARLLQRFLTLPQENIR